MTKNPGQPRLLLVSTTKKAKPKLDLTFQHSQLSRTGVSGPTPATACNCLLAYSFLLKIEIWNCASGRVLLA